MEVDNKENQELTQLLQRIIDEHDLAIDKLTKEQFAKCLREAIDAGDFVRLIYPTYSIEKKHQTVVYRPYYEKAVLCGEVKRLKEFIRMADKFIAAAFYEEWVLFQMTALGHRIGPDEN